MRFLRFLKRPPRWFLLILYIVTLCMIALSILFVTVWELNYPLSILEYLIFALSAITLFYSVFTLICGVPVIKRGVKDFFKKFRLTDSLMTKFGFRTVVFAGISFVINIAYVAFNLVIAIVDRSVWFSALTAYYALLALMRGAVLIFQVYGKRRGECEERFKGLKVYMLCGVGLIVLPVALSFAIMQMVLGTNSFEHAGLTIYVAAAYTFYKIIMAVVNIVKARKVVDVTVRALRSISLADALVSILALQTAMFKEFGSGGAFEATMNAVVGGVVCALTVALGVYMIVVATKRLSEKRRLE